MLSIKKLKNFSNRNLYIFNNPYPWVPKSMSTYYDLNNKL